MATVGFTATEPGSVFDCSPDGASFALCSSPQSLTGLSDGPHTLTVRAIDPVGNPGPVSILRFAVDTSRPPEPRIVRLPTDPRNCALQVFRARMTPRGLKVVMRSEVQRLVKIQLYRRHGPVIGPRRLSVYLGKSVPRTTVRFIRMARIRRSRRVRSYVRLGRARGVVIRIVPRVINEVRGCNQGGRVGARDEVGYASRFARKVVLGSSRR